MFCSQHSNHCKLSYRLLNNNRHTHPMESQNWRFGECVRGKWGDWDPKSKSFRRELKYVLSWNLLQGGGGES